MCVSWGVGDGYDLLLANRIQQRWWDVTFVIWLHKLVASILLEDTLYCFLGLHIWWNKLPYWKDTYDKTWRVASGQQPTRNWGSQSEPQGTEFCQQSQVLRSDSFPSRAFRWDPSCSQHFDCNLIRDSEAEDPAKPCQDSWYHKYYGIINMCDFKQLNWW